LPFELDESFVSLLGGVFLSITQQPLRLQATLGSSAFVALELVVVDAAETGVAKAAVRHRLVAKTNK